MTAFSRVWWFCVVAIVLRPATGAAAPSILPLDQLEPGMAGYGLTVFHGTEVERFDVTVLGVLEAFDFDMDMILIRIESGPCVEKRWGVLEGMSGSPIYVDGKLIGALAYGWPFQTEAVAGVTPIEQMLSQYDPQHPLARAARERRRTRGPAPRLDGAAAEGALRARHEIAITGRSYADFRIAPNRKEALALASARPDLGVLHPVATPLFVRGLGGGSLTVLERLLAPYNIVPLQAGSARVPDGVTADLQPGSAVGVSLGTGDIDLTAIGTVTYVDGDTVLAFGHPFFGLGGVDMPMSVAYIHTIITSAEAGFKLGGPARLVGRITQDRTTCVGGKMGEDASLLPVVYRLVEQARGVDAEFRVNIFRQQGLSEQFAVMLMQRAVHNVAGQGFSGVTSAAVEIAARVPGREEPLRIVRRNAFDSAAIDAVGVNPLYDLFMTLSTLRRNPFGEAKVESVNVSLEFEAERRFANIERAQAARRVVRRGETVNVTLQLKPFGGEMRPFTVPVRVPETAPLGTVVVLLIGGNDGFALRPRINPPPYPRDVPSLVEWLNNSIPNDSVLVEMMLPTTGIDIDGRQLRDFPDPIAKAVATTHNGDGVRGLRDVVEQVIPADEVIAGAAVVAIEVVDEQGRHGEGSADLGGFEAPSQNFMAPPGGMMMEMSTGWAGSAVSGARDIAWLTGPPSRPSVTVEQLDALIRRALPAARPRGRDRLRPRAAADAAPQDDPPAATDGGAGDAPPDITKQLELDKPPKMPAWSELDQLEKGKLVTEAEPGSEKPSESTEGGEDQPIARPVQEWSLASGEEFGAGTFQGTFPSRDGRVALSPPVSRLGTPEAERTWSVAVRGDAVLVGSWDDGAALRSVGPDGQITTLFETDDVGLVAIAVLPDGAVCAGGIPSGRIYRWAGGDTAEVLADLDEPYIWALVSDGQDGLYAATGRGGRVYHVSRDGRVELTLDAGDRHVLALCSAGDSVYAGTWPAGKVYRIRNGAVESVYQCGEAGVLSLAATDAGDVYVGVAGKGQVFRIDTAGAVHELLDGDGGDVYHMTSADGMVYATLSEPGRLYRFDPQDVGAELYRTEEPYLLGLAFAPERGLVTTEAGNGEVLALGLSQGRRGTYLSQVHDAGTLARWGALTWSQEADEGAYIVFETRTGNTAWPDNGWSPWSTQLTAPSGEPVTSPPARYIQLRATLVAEPGQSCRLDGVRLFYRTVNRAPEVTAEKPKPGDTVRGTYEISWSAEDPEDDELTFEVYYAPAGSDEWTRVEVAEESETGEPTADGEGGATGENGEADGEEPANGESAAPGGEGGPTQPNLTPQEHEPAPSPASRLPFWAQRRLTSWLASRRADLPETPGAVTEEGGGGETTTSSEDVPLGQQTGEKSEQARGELKESSLKWDTTKVPDGVYVIKIVARDEVRNPDDPRVVEKLTRPFRVDNTAPYAMVDPPLESAPLPETVTFGDEGCHLASAEYRFDDGPWKALLPVDGIFDSRFETIRIPPAPATPGDHVLTIRVRDAAGNLYRGAWKFTVAEPAAE